MMFENLIKIKHLMEELEICCNAGRTLNEHGNTWQDAAYDKSVAARKIIETTLAVALDTTGVQK